MDSYEETRETYNRSAYALTERYVSAGARSKHIDAIFEFAGNPVNPFVLEIGCGNGRDAQEFLKRTNHYIGIDYSDGMLSVARELLPDAQFIHADASEFNYPEGLDIVCAFASVLHLDKDRLTTVFDKVHKSLNSSGLFYISTKTKPQYSTEIKEDEYGKRHYYFYSSSDIHELAKDKFEVAEEHYEEFFNSEWLEIALRKI